MRVSRAVVVLVSAVGLFSVAVAACSGDSTSNAPLPDNGGKAGTGVAGSTGLGKGGRGGSAGSAGRGGAAGSAGAAGAAGASGQAGAAGAGAGAAGAAGAGGQAGGAGGTCAAGTAGAGGCAEPSTCGNGMLDGDETDIDCGGSCNAKCDVAHACKKGGDCSEGVCTGTPVGVCAKGSCSDGVKNQTETDIDCGGSSLCPKCADTLACAASADCKSGVCGADGHCSAASCADKVQNGTETDIDCGGTCPGKCQLGQKCTGGPDCATTSCLGGKFCGCPTGMVVAPKPAGGAYCIDATEVTYNQYALFWQNNPQANEMGSCSFKKKYTPTQGWPAPTDHVNTPVRWVDWCDAAAYCRFNNKHLCGEIGMDAGVPYDPAALVDPAQSEWYNACSAGGVNLYPYGAQSMAGYEPLKCAGQDFDFAGVPPNDPRQPKTVQGVPSDPQKPWIVQDSSGNPVANSCQGGAPSLFDMSGNVAEWENSCSGDNNELDTCYLRGGSFQDLQANLTCKSFVAQPRGYSDGTTGIRCCL